MHATTNRSINHHSSSFDDRRDTPGPAAYAIRPADHQTLQQGQGHHPHPIEQKRRYKRPHGPSTQQPPPRYPSHSTMHSYGSNKSGHLGPQYQHQQQQQQQTPPYPTTPDPSSQPQSYFPPIPEQQQAVYSLSSSSSPNHQTSPYATMPDPNLGHRRTSSSSSSLSSYNPQFYPQSQTQIQSMPVPIRHPDPHQYQYPAASYPAPVTYARSTSQQSQYSQHGPHYGGLDPETEREFKRRYAREKEFERRPTLGGSLLSMVDKIGKVFGSERH